LEKEREKDFLEAHDGKDFTLRFPIRDIHERNATRRGKGMALGRAPEQDSYMLTLDTEESQDGRQNGKQTISSIPVKLSATEAAWVTQGDQLVVRGKTSYLFASREYFKSDGAWYVWYAGNRTLRLRLREPTLTIERVKADTTLKEKVKARVLQLKSLEAQEGANAQLQDKKADPFTDKPQK
jgi:hypothetical protein